MATQMTPKAKKFLRLLAILAIVGGLIYLAKSKGYLDRIFKKSVDVTGIVLPDAPKTSTGGTVEELPLPSSTVSTKAPKFGSTKINIMAWNAQQPLILANGGINTTEGSLMEKNGVKLTILHQDNDSQSFLDLLNFGKKYHDNPNTDEGVPITVDMSDGTYGLINGANEELAKLDGGKCQFCIVVVGSLGISKGEDSYMATPDVLADPQKAKGSVVSTVLKNGDYNIVLIWAGQNNIKVNNDPTTYDYDAINFINADDYTKAGEIYITGQKETRPVVSQGKKTGQSIEIQANALASWFPVDQNVTEKKGGLVRILSTYENQSQMNAGIFTIRKYAQDHKDLIEGLLKSSFDAADQLKTYPKALEMAGVLSAQVYKSKDGDFWAKAAKGYKTVTYDLKDKTHSTPLIVDIGGSGFHNLADNLNVFGLAQGSTSTFEVVYNTFSKKYLEYFPETFKSAQKYEDVVDLTYLQDLQNAKDVSKTLATTVTYTKSKNDKKLAAGNYHIEFELGKADLTEAGKYTIDNDIYNALVISSNVKIELGGHTDASGSVSINKSLSEARAQAVKTYLQAKAPKLFTDDRFVSVKGYGSSQPILGATAAANRRVSVVLLSN